MTIQSLKNNLIKLTGIHGVKRQQAIIKNCDTYIKIYKEKKQRALAHVNILELRKARKALGTNSNKKVFEALKKLNNNH